MKGKPRSVEFAILVDGGRKYELSALTVNEAQGWLSALSLCVNSKGPLFVEGLGAKEQAATKKKVIKSKEKPLETELVEV